MNCTVKKLVLIASHFSRCLQGFSRSSLLNISEFQSGILGLMLMLVSASAAEPAVYEVDILLKLSLLWLGLPLLSPILSVGKTPYNYLCRSVDSLYPLFLQLEIDNRRAEDGRLWEGNAACARFYETVA